MIPARYAATRFPAKLMQTLGTKTVIRHTYDNTLATGLFATKTVNRLQVGIRQRVFAHAVVLPRLLDLSFA